jgi:hypothetical protein
MITDLFLFPLRFYANLFEGTTVVSELRELLTSGGLDAEFLWANLFMAPVQSPATVMFTTVFFEKGLPLVFRARTLCSFMRFLGHRGLIKPLPMSTLERVLKTIERNDSQPTLFQMYFTKEKPRDFAPPVEARDSRFAAKWAHVRLEAGKLGLDPLMLLVRLQSLPIMPADGMGGTEEFTEFAINNEIARLEAEKHRIERFVEFSVVASKLRSMTGVLASVVHHALRSFVPDVFSGTLGLPLRAVALEELGQRMKVVNDIISSRRFASEFQLAAFCAVLDGIDTFQPSIVAFIRKFENEIAGFECQVDLGVLNRTIASDLAYYRMLLNTIPSVRCGKQLELFTEISRLVSMAVGVLAEFGFEITAAALFAAIWPAELAPELLKAGIRLGHICTLAPNSPEFTEFARLLSWMIALYQSNETLTQELMAATGPTPGKAEKQPECSVM